MNRRPTLCGTWRRWPGSAIMAAEWISCWQGGLIHPRRTARQMRRYGAQQSFTCCHGEGGTVADRHSRILPFTACFCGWQKLFCAFAPEPDSIWTCRSQQQVRLRRCSQMCASGALLRAATMLPCGPICSYQRAFPWANALPPSAWPTKEQEQAPVRLSSLRQIQIYVPAPACFGSLYMQLVWRQTLPLGKQIVYY